jgi:putative transposase
MRIKKVAQMRVYSSWQSRLNEVFVKVNGDIQNLWRAVDHFGEASESSVTKRLDGKAVLKILRKTK